MLSQDEASNVSEILSAIQSLSKDLNAQLGEVRNEFSTQLHDVISSNHEIKEAIGTFSERLTQAESRISAAEDQIASLTEATDTTREKVRKLDMQMEEIENQRRRCNLKLVGIPEGFEKRDCRGFLRAWLPQVLSIEHQLNIEQAYRLGATPSTQNQQQSATRPRVVLVKFLSYHDRDTVLKAARLKEVKLENNHVMFFPDLSPKVQKQRKLFDGVKLRLRHLNRDYGLIFPARLRIWHEDTWHYFNSVAKADKFIDKLRPAIREKPDAGPPRNMGNNTGSG
ncbi:hypothetical protein D5F01_LYC23701 [Larimichthys crocea]|uniref:LINE-1 type transposase domain-containing protein 1 n=1 Tax=Larimichthys crocea TaxID=215358 RepID=A0A6G0HGQ5_LARCR|nr:hypothetical protein D5F01_LYC23701 [Larimichthys crocea]